MDTDQKKICKNCAHYARRFEGEGICKKITSQPVNGPACIETVVPNVVALSIRETFGCVLFDEKPLAEDKKIIYRLLLLIEAMVKTHNMQMEMRPFGFHYLIDREGTELIKEAKKFIGEKL